LRCIDLARYNSPLFEQFHHRWYPLQHYFE